MSSATVIFGRKKDLSQPNTKVEEFIELLHDPEVKVVLQVIVFNLMTENKIFERLGLIDTYLGLDVNKHWIGEDLTWSEMDDIERRLNKDQKREQIKTLDEKLSELEKKVSEFNIPQESCDSLLLGNKTDVRAKLVYKQLKNSRISPSGERYMDSSEIRKFLVSGDIPEDFKIIDNPNKTRSTVYNVIEKVAEMFPDVTKKRKEHGNKALLLVLKPSMKNE